MAESTPEGSPVAERTTGTTHSAKRLLGDMTKNDATKMLLGTSTGCVVGWFAMKAGKIVSFATGSSILFLLIANQTGYIIINWKKIISRLDNIFVKVEEMSETGPQWVDRLECYVDNTLDQLEEKIIMEANRQWMGSRREALQNGQRNATRISRKVQRHHSKNEARDVPVFLVSFIAGIALGIAFT